MRHLIVVSLLLAGLGVNSIAQKKADPLKTPAVHSSPATTADSSARLPVKRVVLYKNGVGYFEHQARVHGTQDVNIDFTTAQLNDVLKSLTAVDLGGGRVSSVRYNSIAPLSERLKTLRLPFGEQVTQAGYLSALRGARLEVRSGGATYAGRLLSVEQKKKVVGPKGETEDVTSYSIVTDAGEMKSFELGSGSSVRVAERELNDEVGRYLNLIGSSRSQDVRRMSFTDEGTGDRELFVSYISEVPVWKSTYRIIFPQKPGGKPLLQGWAIVDNTVGEDWKDVELSLVAGAPQSFVQDISQPVYTRRPVVPLPQSAMLTPQSHEAGMAMDKLEQFAKLQAPSINQAHGDVVRGVIGGIGAGIGGGTAGGSFHVGGPVAPMAGRVASEMVEVEAAEDKQPSEAEGKSAGDFFEYKIKQKTTIGKNQSALVPILQGRIEAEKVTLWNRDSAPLRALWIKNTSGEVLDSGSFNVLEADTFAGEGILETIHPDERRLLSYAGDAAVHVKYLDQSSEDPVSHVRIAKGLMVWTKESHKSTKYTIHNADTEARQIVVEHPAEDEWTLTSGTPKPEESSESYHRFRVPVEAGKNAELNVETIHPEATEYQLSNLDSDVVEVLVQQKRMTPALQQAFDRVLQQKNKVDGFTRDIADRKRQSDQVAADQARIRENMKALKGSAEEKALVQRYVGQLDSQESQLASLRRESDSLVQQQTAARAALDTMIMEVDVDQSF